LVTSGNTNANANIHANYYRGEEMDTVRTFSMGLCHVVNSRHWRLPISDLERPDALVPLTFQRSDSTNKIHPPTCRRMLDAGTRVTIGGKREKGCQQSLVLAPVMTC
jgi:hypothetical protein